MYHIHGLGDWTLQTGQFPQINLKFNAILIKISVRIFMHSVSHVALITPSKESESERTNTALCVTIFFFFNCPCRGLHHTWQSTKPSMPHSPRGLFHTFLFSKFTPNYWPCFLDKTLFKHFSLPPPLHRSPSIISRP